MCYFYFHFLMIKDGYGTVVLKVDGWDGWLYLWDSVSVTGGGGGEFRTIKYRSTSGNCIMDSDVKGVGIRIRIHIR